MNYSLAEHSKECVWVELRDLVIAGRSWQYN
jgi:hypothetical protein